MAIKATTLREDHVSKRETPLGRWFPVILYAVNLALWIAANYVGWFVLMFLTPLAWILIARQREWGYWRKGTVALGALVPLSIAAVMLSLMLNGAVAALKLR
jgi:hypothetical protein